MILSVLCAGSDWVGGWVDGRVDLVGLDWLQNLDMLEKCLLRIPVHERLRLPLAYTVSVLAVVAGSPCGPRVFYLSMRACDDPLPPPLPGVPSSPEFMVLNIAVHCCYLFSSVALKKTV